ncbi:MAG: hypothetical protein C0467_16105 [Planctomycetaceae bacterium]|nr:hypothetical protein [Planctomycetaceae bacterium]
MATLHIMYDLEKKQFIGASTAGQFLSGLGSIVLRNGSLSVLDINGHDLLGTSQANTVPPAEHSKAQADIAEAFGVEAQS